MDVTFAEVIRAGLDFLRLATAFALGSAVGTAVLSYVALWKVNRSRNAALGRLAEFEKHMGMGDVMGLEDEVEDEVVGTA